MKKLTAKEQFIAGVYFRFKKNVAGYSIGQWYRYTDMIRNVHGVFPDCPTCLPTFAGMAYPKAYHERVQFSRVDRATGKHYVNFVNYADIEFYVPVKVKAEL